MNSNTKQMHLCAFTSGCVGHHFQGQWKNPSFRRGASEHNKLSYWMEFARTLERGHFDCMFLADVQGTYDVYKGSESVGISQGMHFPILEPTVLVPAMASATRHLGFACTYSTTYFAPYQTARLFSTLDHLTEGRIAWNIVTSYLPNALANFDIREKLTHDERYERADEYMDVVYKLWEKSWDEDAIIRDRDRDMFIDPDRVHRIDHEGTWFNVQGPHLIDPSPQRTPVLFQAGSSSRGVGFAGRHAEAVFLVIPGKEACAKQVRAYRDAVSNTGRDPTQVKLMGGMVVVVGQDDADARHKEQILRSYASDEANMALLGGLLGIDYSKVPTDVNLSDLEGDAAVKGLKGVFAMVDPNRNWTLDAIKEFMEIGGVFPSVTGSPSSIADQLEEWMDYCDLDGFNLHVPMQASGYVDFVNLVVPELQRRGRVRTKYEGSTLRELFFGTGQKRLDGSHPAKNI